MPDSGTDDNWQPPVEIPVVCRTCNTRMHARPDQVGQHIECPDCSTLNVIRPPKETPQPRQPSALLGDELRPAPHVDQPDVIQEFNIVCRVCDSMIYCQAKDVGTIIQCGDCGTTITVAQPPIPKRKPTIRPIDPGIAVRPAAKQEVFNDNASKLMATATKKVLEKEKAKPIPPKRPFIDGVWRFPGYLSVFPVVLILGMISGFIPILMKMAVETQGKELLFGIILWGAALVLSVGVFILAARTSLAIIETTATGHDKMEHWPDFEIFEWLKSALFFVNSLAVCCMPAGFLAIVTGASWITLLTIPILFLLFPFILLSMLDENTPMMPYSEFMYRSIGRVKGAWIKFYVQSAILFAIVIGVHVAAIGLSGTMNTVASFGSMLLTAAAGIIYVRLVGRLAWVIDEKMAKKKPIEDDNEVSSSSEMVMSK